MFVNVDWDKIKSHQYLFDFCSQVNHETVGWNCHCRCGKKRFEPWEMPVTDAIFKIDSIFKYSVLEEYE